MKKKHPKVGKRVICISGCYEGEIGTIEYCGKCCRKYRVEWDRIGNNTGLLDLKRYGCDIQYLPKDHPNYKVQQEPYTTKKLPAKGELN